MICHKCNKTLSLELGQPIPRREECPHCSGDLRCCRMCQFYDATAFNECKEPVAERIVDKSKANFCNYFRLGHGVASAKTDGDSILDAANKLFKK